jgi:hypothetical protein
MDMGRVLGSIGVTGTLLLAACVEPGAMADDLEAETEAPATATVGATSGQSTTTSTTDPTETDTDPPDTTFIVMPDGFNAGECAIWEQDCAEGEKCMPYANDGGSAWNSTRCSPVTPDAGQPGDPCSVEGSGVSGVDTCDVSSMCWDVDPETNTGTCVAFCTGNQDFPVCDDPATACSITNEGVLILCLPACDPLLQDCAEGQACYGIDNAFVCAPDASGGEGVFGSPCEFINACGPGLACVGAGGVPDCTGSLGCCSSYCDLSDAGSSGSCEGASGGQECISWFEENSAPPGFEDVGVCFIPQ